MYQLSQYISVFEEKRGKRGKKGKRGQTPFNSGGIISSLKTNEDSEGKELYYHYDGLGSVTNLSNLKGKTKANYSYDGFGNLINRKRGKPNP